MATGNYRHELGDAAHRELLACLRAAKGLVVLAGYPSVLYDEVLHDWLRITRPARAAGSKKLRPALCQRPEKARHIGLMALQPR